MGHGVSSGGVGATMFGYLLPRALLAVASCGALVGCIASTHRGYPLYGTASGRPDIQEIARLAGYVRYVDGRDVSSLGGSFELMPGCHVVGTPSQWGTAANNGATVRANTGKWIFALPMKAGSAYSVELELPELTGPTGTLEIRAFERNARGETTRTFTRATSTSDIEDCQREGGESPSGGGEATSAAPAGDLHLDGVATRVASSSP